MQGEWIRRPQGAAALAVFVHGILSSGEKCWRHDNGIYWPELLKDEPELGSLGIYVFTYQTGTFSGSYRLGDIVDALKEHMRLDGVLESNQIIFVCHSLGGIVVRKYIVERQAELIGAGKEIDLFLVASPSLGATYADWLSPLAQLFGHAQADALRFVRNNNWLMDLDKEFMNLKEGGTLRIEGKELVEHKFIELKKIKLGIVWRRQVVEPFSGARYFGEPYKVPASDHFSIAKPKDKTAIQHRLLSRFILENARSPEPEARKPPPDPDRPPVPADISRIDKYAPAELIGREAETQLLNDAWAKAQNNEIQATARPHLRRPRRRGEDLARGEVGGKPRISKLAGVRRGVRVVLLQSGPREQVAASSDVFLKEALTYFGDAAMAGSAQGAFDKGRGLAQLAGERRALLILDGLEPLQYAPTSPTPGELKDSGIAALLKGLAANNRGLCVVTTRISIPDLRAFWQTTAPQVDLPRLSKEAGVELLQRLGVKGTQAEFETLVEDVKGHALTLNLLGGWLRDAHAGDIRMRDQVKLEEVDEEQGGHAFRVMDAYVQWFKSAGKNGKRALAMLRLLGLFDRPADAGCLKALWKAPLIPNLTEPLAGTSEAHRNLAISRLEGAKLLTVNRGTAGALLSLDAHPLLREYFAKVLREQRPEAWRAAHRRLYEHLCATTKDKPQPTLDDLQPLLQAVSHGCQAGIHKEACATVYRTRILRGREFHSTNKLGAFGSDLGAVACFFEEPWGRVSPALAEADQSWLLGIAAYDLHALGRLTEAFEPERASLAMIVEREDWWNAASGAGNLSWLELTLGEVALAAADAEQAVTYAERSGDKFQRMSKRAVYAHTLHQAGRRDEAAALFREAEEIQAERQPEEPLLYALHGFHYCDLFLAAAECAAWRRMLNLSCVSQPSPLPESCRAVSGRAVRTLHWAERGNLSLYSIALNRLTLGRAALYAAILEGVPLDHLDPCRESLQHTVDGLRRAGNQDFLPLGLLTRAWLRLLTGARTGHDSAQSDLDEAHEITERGPMPLHMADIHLHRARLFGLSEDRTTNYPWTSPQHDLAEARRLIEKHGYGRRKEELEDAEAAARGVSDIPV